MVSFCGVPTPAPAAIAIRATIAPTLAGSVAAVARQVLPGSVISWMSAVETSTPYTFTLSAMLFCRRAIRVPLASSS